jgi:hypothetical protein
MIGRQPRSSLGSVVKPHIERTSLDRKSPLAAPLDQRRVFVKGLAVFIIAGMLALLAWGGTASWENPPTSYVLLTSGVLLAAFALCIVVLVNRGRDD